MLTRHIKTLKGSFGTSKTVFYQYIFNYFRSKMMLFDF